jgi:hypothetical protein
VDDYNTVLSSVDRSPRPKKKINKETSELNYTIDQMELANIYRIFHPTAAEYFLLSKLWNFLQNRYYFRL